MRLRYAAVALSSLIAGAAAGQPCPPQVGPGYLDLPLSSGVSGHVEAVVVDDTGPAPSLVVGGNFDVLDAAGAVLSDLARWDGDGWSAVGEGPPGGLIVAGALGLAVFDDGAGPALYAGHGAVSRLEGGVWTEVGEGLDGAGPLHVLDLGTGPRLYATKSPFGPGLRLGGATTRAAVWSGGAWHPLGEASPLDWLEQLVALEDDLYGLRSRELLRFDDGEWTVVPTVPAHVQTMATFDDGAGMAIWLGSDRPEAAGHFDGESFEPNAELVGVFDLMARSEAGGEMLYASRQDDATRHTVRRFDGDQWEDLAEVVDTLPYSRLTDISGFAGPGALTLSRVDGAVDGVPMRNIIEYSGGDWRPIGAGAPPVVFAMETGAVSRLAIETIIPGASHVRQLAIDDGTGLRSAGPANFVSLIRTLTLDGEQQTFVGGSLPTAGGEFSHGLFRWTESGFEQLGDTSIDAFGLGTFDAGAGTDLYAGGSFWRRDPPLNNLARWSGSEWVDVGGGVDGFSPWVSALAAFDDGAGPALYIGGRFESAGDAEAYGFARWDGETLSAVPDGPSGVVSELQVVEVNGEPLLIAAGVFTLPALSGELIVLATYDGVAWRPLGHDYQVESYGVEMTKTPIVTMTPLVVGERLMVYISGRFTLRLPSGHTIYYSALFDGEQWHAILPNDEITSSAPTPDGSSIAIGGSFATFGGEVHPGLATITPCTCPADLDGDGELTFFDFLVFQNLFAAGDLRADFDGDGELTFFDFLAFQNEFAAGCP